MRISNGSLHFQSRVCHWLKQNYNLEERIFLRELYAIVYKQEEIGECYRFALHYTPPLWRSVNCPCSLN